jgi:hypothetical protein
VASLDVAVAREEKPAFINACTDEYLGMYPADPDGLIHRGMVQLEIVAKKGKNLPARLRNL